MERERQPTGEGWAVGVDSGGTFTDLVALEGSNGGFRVVKVPSTPSRPVDAVAKALDRADLARELARLVHGTTVTTNVLLERRGARLCLLTTSGFEDVPFIQRLNRRFAYNLHWRKPTPLVKRRHTLGVRERVDHRGVVAEELTDEESERVVGEVTKLVHTNEIEAIAVCLLFSYMNDEHERAIERRLRAELPDVPVSISSRVSPLWREYERVSTVLADAYVKPLMSGYLKDLSHEVGQRTSSAPLLVLKSNGGTASPEAIAPTPLGTLFSGLAGGVVGGAYFAAAAGEARSVTFDMGGTSTDIGLVHDGAVDQLHEYEIEWGLPIATPVVDVHTIGAGGGSIARVDHGGLLRVGPESAGAVPGPACYGHGGEQPTVTDANLILGRLNPNYFLGGEMRLDLARAAAALDSICELLGLDQVAAARAVVEIANENMANAIRLVTIERGLDPQDYALVAFGGAGPLHACGVADAVGMNRIVVPPHPGLCSAFGAAIAPLRVDRVRSLGVRSDTTDESEIRRLFEELERDAQTELASDRPTAETGVRRVLACRYYMQNYEQEVQVPDLEPGFLARASEVFHDLHREVYGYSFQHDPVEFVHCKLTAYELKLPVSPEAVFGRFGEAKSAGTREIVDANGAGAPIQILRRGQLAASVSGPVVIEESDSTILVPDGWSIESAPADCLVLRRRERR